MNVVMNLLNYIKGGEIFKWKYSASQECLYFVELVDIYVGHLESKERLRIQPAQLFNFS